MPVALRDADDRKRGAEPARGDVGVTDRAAAWQDEPGGADRRRACQLFGIDTPLEAVNRLVARWHPYAGVVYSHLLLDSLSRAGLVDQPLRDAQAGARLMTAGSRQ
jgi:hypothetical protein